MLFEHFVARILRKVHSRRLRLCSLLTHLTQSMLHLRQPLQPVTRMVLTEMNVQHNETRTRGRRL